MSDVYLPAREKPTGVHSFVLETGLALGLAFQQTLLFENTPRPRVDHTPGLVLFFGGQEFI